MGQKKKKKKLEQNDAFKVPKGGQKYNITDPRSIIPS